MNDKGSWVSPSSTVYQKNRWKVQIIFWYRSPKHRFWTFVKKKTFLVHFAASNFTYIDLFHIFLQRINLCFGSTSFWYSLGKPKKKAFRCPCTHDHPPVVWVASDPLKMRARKPMQQPPRPPALVKIPFPSNFFMEGKKHVFRLPKTQKKHKKWHPTFCKLIFLITMSH